MTSNLSWITVLAGVVVAMIGGGFGLVQLSLKSHSERDLEMQKLEAQRLQAELTRQQETHAQFRQQQALPFLEQLNLVIGSSYPLVELPRPYLQLAAAIPQLRGYANKVEGNWLDAMLELSNRRTQMLVAIASQEAVGIAALMTELTTLANQLLGLRRKSLDDRAYVQELASAQSEFVRIGYLLMIRIKQAALAPYRQQETLTTEDMEKVADMLSESLRRTAVFSLPFGTTPAASWLAIWQLDMQPEQQCFIDQMTHQTQSDFDESIRALASEIDRREDVVDSYLAFIEDAVNLYCIAVRFDSVTRCDEFIGSELALYRRKYRVLWSTFRAPSEMTV